MKITQLRYALAVARERSFSRAAEACNVSQPSLSVAVRQLEEELNTPLFERFKNRIQITEAGSQVLEQVQKALEEVEQIRHVADSKADSLEGTLRFGAIYSVGPYLFPTLVPTLRRLAPNMTLLLEENYTAVLSERLKRGEVDAIIVALPYAEPGIEVLPIHDEPFIAAVPNGHPWQDREDLDGDELAGEKLLLLGKGHCFRDQVLEICGACHHLDDTSEGMHNSIEGNSLETIRHMVAVGTGVAVLPITSVNSFLCMSLNCPERSNHLVKYVRFRDPVPFRRIALAWRSSFPNMRAIETLATAMRKSPPAGVDLVLDAKAGRPVLGLGGGECG
ncbi:MAG: hydrogen peroxide-inducible genes activator [Hyphomicrobiales bacterium]|nr:hydrogen peroxide-inducible genes activator [Hyphomicrobiales bacterium]MCP5373995.1 hydrogen peroxide-inducible genes activator [Hyphomicrobiales bacterium]